jgi:hypothetical protein
VRHQTGQLRADLFDAPNDFRLSLESTMSPEQYARSFRRSQTSFLREWQWQRSPAIRMAIRGTDRNPESWQGDGTVALGRTRFRGTWMNRANARIHFADGAVTCEDIQVTRERRHRFGSFTVRFQKARGADPECPQFVVSGRSNFSGSIRRPRKLLFLTSSGVRRMSSPTVFTSSAAARTHTAGDQGRGASEWTTSFLPKRCRSIVSRRDYSSRTNACKLANVRADLLGRHAAREMLTSRWHETIRVTDATLSVSEINFPSLTALYFNYKTCAGPVTRHV